MPRCKKRSISWPRIIFKFAEVQSRRKKDPGNGHWLLRIKKAVAASFRAEKKQNGLLQKGK